MKALVLAGGFGTRLRPLTYGFAKQMIPVANKPILFYALEDVKNAGIEEVIINVAPHSKDDVTNAIGDGSIFGLKVKYNLQEAPLGIAHAIKIARPLIGDEDFVVYLGDNILRNGIKNYRTEFYKSGADGLALVSKVPNPERFGTVEVQGKRVTRLVEKPKVPTSDLAMVGVYFLKPIIFDSIEKLKPSWRNELEVVDAYQDLINQGRLVEAIEVEGWWADTGTAEDLLAANRLILGDLKPVNNGELEDKVVLEGKVAIGKGSAIRGNSRIRGPAIIGENCKIGPDTYVGPYTAIGSNVEVRSTEIENSIVMDGARIFSGGKILDSLIGKETEIEKRKMPPAGTKLVLGQGSYVGM